MVERLSDYEIKKRLQQLRFATNLHASARARFKCTLMTIDDLKLKLNAKNIRIAEMEVLLANQESQRKELSDRF